MSASSHASGVDVLGAAERLLYSEDVSHDERFGEGCDGAERLDSINKMYGKKSVDPRRNSSSRLWQ